jgi:UDP-N-acetylmuramoyl-tripeptide--D-alanyl-D-alanine ligase
MSSEEPSPANIPLEIKLLKTQPFIKVAFLSENRELKKVKSKLIGVYNFNNIMTAIALGKYFKVPAIKIKHAIEDYIPSNNRSQIVEGANYKIILDAYNANPSSMKSALESFLMMEGAQKVVILGAMKELGIETDKEHAALVQMVTNATELEQIILVGHEYKNHITDKLHYFENVADLKPWFTAQNWENHLLLIKGSRSNQLEQLLG